MSRRKIVSFMLTIAGLFSIITSSNATTITPATCSLADVQEAVTQAGTGDTVLVPKGACSWGAGTLYVSKAIHIIGAGGGSSATCDESVSTCISGTGVLVSLVTSSTPSIFAFRLSGLYLSTTGAASGTYGHILNVSGAGSGWRIDNNYFYHTFADNVYKAIVGLNANVAYWTLYGVIDSNTFKNVYVYLGGGASAGEQGWQQTSQWGTANALFIENNHFDFSDSTVLGVAVDNQNGGKATIRYNIFDDMYLMIHSACALNVRGGRSYEVYNNLFRNKQPAASSGPYYVHLRAGSALITKNHVAGRWTWGSGLQGYVAMDNRRSWLDSGCTNLGWCDGTSVYDSNIPNSAIYGTADGYRCLDQIGAGTQTGTLGSGQTQALDPVYVWSNTSGKVCLSGADMYKSCTSNSDCVNSDCSTQILTPNNAYKVNDTNNQPNQIVSGRDYYDVASGANIKQDYTPYTCPHPLAGKGSCNTNVSGTNGYDLANALTPPVLRMVP